MEPTLKIDGPTGNYEPISDGESGGRRENDIRALWRCCGTTKWNQRRLGGGKYVRTLVSREGLEPSTP